MNVTGMFADFSVAPVRGDAALSMMRLSLFDWAACGIAGRDEPVARIVRHMVLAEGGAGEAGLIGGGAAPARGAALANGTASHALDYDDTHFGHIGHPSVAVIPAALAIAQKTGADGARFVQACLVGAELSVRVGMWLGRAHYQLGFHQTGTAGAFGATAAAGRLLGLDAGAMAHALGLCTTRASGLKSQFGTMGKPYNAGIAATNGVECAILASAGFVSNAEGLQAPQGFGDTHAGQGDPTALDGLGKGWRLETVSHKFHACCHGIHATLEALATLDADAARVESVEITVHPRWLTVCNIATPRTGLEAKFSYRLCAAMALSGHDTGALRSYSDAACNDPGLVALRDRVRVSTDETLPETAARVSVKAGERLETCHDLDAPISPEEQAAKLRAKAAALLARIIHDAPVFGRIQPAGGGLGFTRQ
ncbi:MAG: MmgE/PrpD family protein [Rhodobacteraceae bacterium]|nr:MmgE/PrpD family protein [Paracoccaceae bacterium]